MTDRKLKWEMAVLAFRTPMEQATISLWEAIAGAAGMVGDLPTWFRARGFIQSTRMLAVERYLEDKERQYAEAQARWEAHKKQVEDAENADREATSDSGSEYSAQTESSSEGSLASDEALQALRDKLTSGS